MKILIDMNLSLEWISIFEQHGWHAVHWQEIGDPRAPDHTIMDWALANNYVVFTRDLDFGTFLATTRAQGPSVIQVRRPNTLPHNFEDWFVEILHQHESALERGALLTVDGDRARMRLLPFPAGGL